LHRNFGALLAVRLFPTGADIVRLSKTKKADVVQHPKAFYHVGILFNKPPGRAELFFV
jgi:hypothetical protein